MPHDVGSLGFDTHLWVGLGMAGLWSALDAFAERAEIAPVKCSVCGRKNCLSSRLTNTSKLNGVDESALKEMEDLRHLFAHNYAGRADSVYFKWTRHVLHSGVSVSLSSGAIFDGATIALTAAHLQYYAKQSRDIIGKLL
jgi:hypothetical protein